jgi:Domain found in Dishevelled, Egl-10, and Pleckstrin (DEP)
MHQTNIPTALLCMPPGEARNAVRAALMAMNVVPQDILPSRTELEQLAHTLHASSHSVAIIDLEGVRHAAAHVVALAALLHSPEARQRTLLTRPQRGLWAADRAWAQALGFADMVSQLDSVSLGSESHHVLDWVARLTGSQPLRGDVLARYFSAMQVKPDTNSPRATIRKATGLSAEALCASLASSVKALNRSYHLKSYPSCFVGTEAVAWLSKQYTLQIDQAVALGTALQALGMLHHVAHEHAFANEAFFYRTAISTAVERINPGVLLRLLSSKTGVEVRSRLYHGKTYADCFIGSDAVDWVHTTQKIARHEAEIALNRLHGFNLIEHVTHDHPVRDGMFFYRFVA